MTKVVLLAINAKYVHSSLAVWVLSSSISAYAKGQYDVSVVEATINQKLTDVVECIKAHKPDFLGISTYIWNIRLLPELFSELRKHLPDLVIALGGPEASHNAEYWLDNGADYVICGEGELQLPMLLDKLSAANIDTEPVFNSANSCATSQQSAALVGPYTVEYFSALKGRLSYIETSRGCPFQCAFCLSGDSQLKFFPMDIVKNQIRKLASSDTKTIKFVDRTFNCNASRAYEIFEYIIGLDCQCRFHFEVAADLFDEKTLDLLSTAPLGLIQFEIGLQSFYEPALDASSRQTNLEKVVSNIKRLLQISNIHIHVDLIAGLPYETLEQFKNSFNRAYSLRPHVLQLGFLKLLHGSALRKNAASLGIEYSKVPPYEIIRSKWLSSDDLQELKIVENALQHTYNKGRFLTTLSYILTVTGKDAYTIMLLLGTAVPNHGTQLEEYVKHIYNFFLTLPDVNENKLTDHLLCDWLGMVKGKNAPPFLKNNDDRRVLVLEKAREILGRDVARCEYHVLSSGVGVVVDSNSRNPITGLYNIFSVVL